MNGWKNSSTYHAALYIMNTESAYVRARALQWCRARARKVTALVLSPYLVFPERVRARVAFSTRMMVEGVCDLEVEGIDTRDAPDFSDAFLTGATWKRSGDALTEEQIDSLNEDHDLVYEAVINRLH